MKEGNPSPESIKNRKIEIVAAEDGLGAKNCVVIKDVEGLDAAEIARLAIRSEAFVEDRDEASDDSYVVQFPGRGQEVLTDDGLGARLNESKFGAETE